MGGFEEPGNYNYSSSTFYPYIRPSPTSFLLICILVEMIQKKNIYRVMP